MNDLKYAFRTLLKSPGFTAISLITLALGIGASTSIFSVLDAVLLRPLPYPQQERLVEVRELDESGRGMRFADPNFDDLRARSQSFEAIASYSESPEAVAGGSEPVHVNLAPVSDDFFRVLGVPPFIGRLFGAPDSSTGPVAVVSYGFWKRQLQGQMDLQDAVLRFGGKSFSVVGVLPPRTEFPGTVDVWHARGDLYPPNESRTSHNVRVIGRLRPGVTMEQASGEVAAIGRQLKAEHGLQTDAASFGIAPVRERMVKDVRGILLVLCGAVALLLAIACANVANLLLVRASARRKEVALRSVLGASRMRLARQYVVESLLLTLVAGALGVLVAVWGVDLIVGLYHGSLPRVQEIGVNRGVLLFALVLSVSVGVLLGLIPALQTSRRQLQGDLQETGRGGTSSPARIRTRNILIVSQVALTLALLVGAGLLGRSFQRLLEVDPGFRSESAVAMTVSMVFPESPAAQRQLAHFYQELLNRVKALPGVTAVGGTSALPMSGRGANGTFLMQGGGKPAETMEELIAQFKGLSNADKARDADFRVASSGYFAAMGIPLIKGRAFTDSDGPESPHVAVISQSLARRYWPNEDPLGRQIQFGNMDGDVHLLNIVGIVGDVRDNGLDAEVHPTVYVNYFQRPRYAAEFSVVVRARGDVGGLIAAMRREVRALNPEMPTKFQPVTELISASLDNRRFSMLMLAIFAGSALILAMVGLYGVMAYITAQRTHEIGIRMALGAQRFDMLRMIFRQSFTLVVSGVVLGIIASFLLTRLLASMLYGVEATDILTYAGVVGVLVAAAALASYIPARRAMKVDPMVALRYE